jgi:hypothetical protein
MAKGKSILSDPIAQGLIGLGIGIAGGLLANRTYQNGTEAERRAWDRDRIMHHGEIGAIATTAGIAAKSPFVTGAGVGLMLTDLQDANQWFAKRKTT